MPIMAPETQPHLWATHLEQATPRSSSSVSRVVIVCPACGQIRTKSLPSNRSIETSLIDTAGTCPGTRRRL